MRAGGKSPDPDLGTRPPAARACRPGPRRPRGHRRWPPWATGPIIKLAAEDSARSERLPQMSEAAMTTTRGRALADPVGPLLRLDNLHCGPGSPRIDKPTAGRDELR